MHEAFSRLKEQARGREIEILVNVAGIPLQHLDGKHHPCPSCGGTDRFNLAYPEDGGVRCNACFPDRNGDFIAAVKHFRNLPTQLDAARLIGEHLGIALDARNHGQAKCNDGASSDAEPPATGDVTHQVYSALLSALPLPDRHRESLRERGLSDEAIDRRGYKTQFQKKDDWIRSLIDRFGHRLLTVPGFYLDDGKIKLAGASGILIPVRDLSGRIIALRTRSDKPDTSGSKYTWVSSKKHGGPGPGAPVHVPLGTPQTAEVVRVTEGELKADIAFELSGLPTLSVAGVSNWKPVLAILRQMRAKTVRLAFDADYEFNAAVRGHLYCFGQAIVAARLNVEIERWELPTGKGIDDVLAAGGETDILSGSDAIEFLESLNDAAKKAPPPFVPFPVVELPEPFANFVKRGAGAIGCDETCIALPLLSAAAAVVGNSRRISLKTSWCEPCVLWTVVVAESGAKKSPSFDLALRELSSMQSAAFRVYKTEREQYEIQKNIYDAAMQDWKRKGRKNGELQPQPPDEPVPERFLCEDTTVEALAVLLERQPRGLLMARDELSGWLNSFDAYKAARGADVAHWLQMHRAAPLIVDRKSGRTLIHVPRAAVSIAGCIQPKTLGMALAGRSDSADGHEHFENGLAARLLLAMPPRRPALWTESDVDPLAMAAVESVFEKLRALQFELDEHNEPVPVDLPLTPAGKQAWIRFYNEHATEQVAMTGDIGAAWSKLEGYAARLALLVQLVRVAARDPTAVADAVDEQSIQVGVTLARWFGDEASRVYELIGGKSETRDDRDQRQLLTLIRDKGGSITPRELMRACRRFRGSADTAEAALQKLVDSGVGRWETLQTGGRPRQQFVLTEAVDSGDGDTSLNNTGKSDLLSPSPVSPEPKTELVI